MNNLQYAIILVLALSAAASVFSFDKRGKSHKPIAAWVAYLTLIQMGSLALAAYMKADNLMNWLMIFGLAVQVGAILLAKGNISRVYSKSYCECCQTPPIPKAPPLPHIHTFPFKKDK